MYMKFSTFHSNDKNVLQNLYENTRTFYVCIANDVSPMMYRQ
jgi:hypothetical protein